jgi:adenine phosphoribosyltransferase
MKIQTASPDLEEKLKKIIRDVPDFPKKGIIFKDITTLLKHPQLLKQAIDAMTAPFLEAEIDQIVGIESRGFIFSPILAYRLGTGFIPIRKPGKLPAKTVKVSYALEYGEDALEIHEDAVRKGDRVLIVDDLLATGGTAQAARKLIEKIGGEVIGFVFLVELTFLNGRKKLGDVPIHSLVKY